MTVIPIRPEGRGAQSGNCRVCGKTVGHVTKHEPACREAHAAFQASAGPEMMAAVERAGCIGDLDMARVFLHLERGRSIVQTGNRHRWLAEPDGALNTPKARLSATVEKMLADGLVRAVSKPTGAGISLVRIEAYPVHLRGPEGPSCRERGYAFRMLDDVALVDCEACLGKVR